MPVRLQILSDLHIDSYQRRGLPVGQIPKTNCDAIIVAGDTANGSAGIEWLVAESKRLKKPIFAIAGNHDYFGQDVSTFDQKLRACTKGSLVTFLQCDRVDFMGLRLLGTTLWTDYQYNATSDTLLNAAHFMRDYREIFYQDTLYTPENSVTIHQSQRTWLLNELKLAHEVTKPTVVISHHSISPNSISEKFADLSSNAGFVTDFSSWLAADFAPKVWIHGHTHEAFDYIQNHTRVVVNPRAYPGETSSTNIKFDWAKVIEVAV